MKIVNRKTFLEMPEGTLYQKYTPCIFANMNIKGETLLPNDFCVQGLHDSVKGNSSTDEEAVLFIAEVTGGSFGLDFYVQYRDGCFDDDQLFAVWERADVDALIERLKQVVCVHFD